MKNLSLVLGRKENEGLVSLIDDEAFLGNFRKKTILITGANGSIGRAVSQHLSKHGIESICTDLHNLDVTNFSTVLDSLNRFEPDFIFHLAAAKHAPEGETDPVYTYTVNTIGTNNILKCAWRAKVVFASTCKACNPETVYGASKMISERMTLNAGHNVARFYNVVETSENVFETWAALPPEEPILYTDCYRYFISLREAVGLVLVSAVLPRGRYAVNPGESRHMKDIADALYPDRKRVQMERRRGDRIREPRKAHEEEIRPTDMFLDEIVGYHDGTI
jgi:FlaA1/EpsC-like NDP-sugar epimerase